LASAHDQDGRALLGGNISAELRPVVGATEAAAKHLDIVRSRALAQERWRAEADKLGFLRQTFLTDARTAGLWWLGASQEKLPQLGKMASDGVFENAVAALTGENTATPGENLIAHLIETFLVGLPPHVRANLIGELSRVFRGYERPDLADRLSDLSNPSDALSAGIA
jgi:hypothetical protein